MSKFDNNTLASVSCFWKGDRLLEFELLSGLNCDYLVPWSFHPTNSHTSLFFTLFLFLVFRYRVKKIEYSSLPYCPPRKKVLITDEIQGITCPTGRERFPVGSIQSFKERLVLTYSFFPRLI